MNKKQFEKTILFFSVFLILGVVISLQFRGVKEMIKKANSSSFKTDELIEQLAFEEETTKRLKAKLENTLTKRDEIIKNSLELKKNTDYLRKEWERTNYLAGFTDIRGEGVRITLEDSKEENINPKYSIIHDTDILKIINELNIAGALAISLNGERIVSTSEIICAGPTVRVNRSRYTTPFVIEAIGEPNELVEALESSFIVNDLRVFKIKVEITKQKDIKIHRYTGRMNNLKVNVE